MRLFLLALFPIAMPLFDPLDAGGGSGAGAGGGDHASTAGRGTGASPASGGSGRGPAQGGGTGAAQPFRLADDALVDLGDGRTGTWRDLREQHFMDRGSYDRGVQLLEQLAGDLDSREQQLLTRITAAQRGERPDGSRMPASDPFAELEGMPIVDGKTLAKYARDMVTNGFGTQAATITSLATRLQQLEQQNGRLATVANRTTEREQETNFARFVSEAVTKMGPVKGVPEGVTLPTDSPLIADIARDLWSSYEPNSWKSAAEFHQMLNTRVAGMIAFVRQLDKLAVDAGQQARKRFFDTRHGSGTPRGEAPYRHLRGDDLAGMLFHGSGTDRT